MFFINFNRKQEKPLGEIGKRLLLAFRNYRTFEKDLKIVFSHKTIKPVLLLCGDLVLGGFLQ